MRRIASLILVMFIAACSGDDNAPIPDQSSDRSVIDLSVDNSVADLAVDAQPADTSSPDVTKPDTGPVPPKLTSSHSGWKKSLCFSCHDGTTAKYPHGSKGYKEPKCGECHSYNGAPHKDHATTNNSGCKGCHTTTQDDHGNKFTAPADCVACHFHPGV
ncbi:MAG: hypothetical protein KAI47_06485 [Deltaproteobacteria bacterium]|nr:hypothetical protein [Deltaproteobacteria bacterium]